jgi:hypothetical protein
MAEDAIAKARAIALKLSGSLISMISEQDSIFDVLRLYFQTYYFYLPAL